MKLSHTITSVLAAAALFAFLPFSSVAEEASERSAAANPALTEELDFIKALVEAGMPDLAEPVIAAAKKKWPEAGPKLKVLELQGSLLSGNFAAVEKAIAELKGQKGKEGEYWALQLSMADSYYARGMMQNCAKIYEEFFKTITKPGPDLLEFYVESGFRWAQICVREKRFDDAVQMYGNLLTKSLPEERWCMVAMEDVELLLRLVEEIPADPKDKKAKKRAEYLKKATTLVDKLLWKNELIIVFGKAIAMKAHIEMLHGNPEKAQTLVNDFMPQLSEIHRSLVEQDPDGARGYVRSSPMPECRYLLAKMFWEAAKAESKKPKPDEDFIKNNLFGARGKNGKRNGLGAYNHAINVCAKYQDSSWAADAADMTEEIAKFVLERYKKEIKTNISDRQRETMRKMKYQAAYDLYRGQEYEKAVKEYEKILSTAPESEDAVHAYGVLADCYVNLRQNAPKDSPDRKKYAELAAAKEDFVASQYKDNKNEALVRAAGDETLRLAAKENDFGERGNAQRLYDAYFTNYPNHYNAAQTAYVLASRALRAEEFDAAIKLYMRVLKYPKSPHFVDALQSLAVCYSKKGDVQSQLKCLRAFVAKTAKLDARASARAAAQLSLAGIQLKNGFAKLDEIAKLNDGSKTNAEAVASVEALRAEATNLVFCAVGDFDAAAETLAKILSSKGGSLDEKERAQYLTRREQALFAAATALARLKPEDVNVAETRARAVEKFEKYLKDYPKGRYAPQALVKIGTIHTANKDMENAKSAFARLQRDFAEKDEAKNSVPQLAKTLIEMGMKSEAAAEYKKMLDTDGKYTPGQFLLAGNTLLEAGNCQLAGDAYAKVIALTNASVYVAPALLGQAEAAYKEKKYEEARQKLDEFIEKFSKSALVIKAYDMLVDVAAIEGSSERDDAARMNLFNTSVRAIKKLRNYSKDPLELAELDLRSGEMLLRKMKAESAMGPSAAAALKDTRGRAIVAFRAFLIAHEPTDKHPFEQMSQRERDQLERCYARLLPIMAEHGSDKDDIVAYGKKYNQLFPDGAHKQDVERALKTLSDN